MLELDLVLAILHHFLVFALLGVLFSEFVVVRRGLAAAAAARVARIDAWYGVLAGLIVIVGFSRAIFAAKGWAYYAHNAFFWAKIGTFIAIGLLSVPPTLAFPRWRRAGTAPTDEAVAEVRRYLWMQVALFPLLLAFAAAMARGYGMF
jgi:putative membrane protein